MSSDAGERKDEWTEARRLWRSIRENCGDIRRTSLAMLADQLLHWSIVLYVRSGERVTAGALIYTQKLAADSVAADSPSQPRKSEPQ